MASVARRQIRVESCSRRCCLGLFSAVEAAGLRLQVAPNRSYLHTYPKGPKGQNVEQVGFSNVFHIRNRNYGVGYYLLFGSLDL